MGIEIKINGEEIQFNSVLTLRKPGEHKDSAQCIPYGDLDERQDMIFRKDRRRIYPLEEELPLHITDGQGELSEKLATVRITSYTHKKINGNYVTEGHAKVTSVNR